MERHIQYLKTMTAMRERLNWLTLAIEVFWKPDRRLRLKVVEHARVRGRGRRERRERALRT